MFFRKKKDKKKNDLELKGVEKQKSLKTPIGEYSVKKIYAPKETSKPISQLKPTVKAESKKSQPDKKKDVKEDTVAIRAGSRKVIELGNLKRGTKIFLECAEREGGVMSYRILDSTNYKRFKSKKRVPKVFMFRLDEIEPKGSGTVKITDDYYLILTTRAQYYSKKVWYRVEIHE